MKFLGISFSYVYFKATFWKKQVSINYEILHNAEKAWGIM
jgi:hypothetical protein